MDRDRNELPLAVLRFASLPEDRQDVLLRVNALLDPIEYGTLVVVVQDRKVIQLEASEKFRIR